MGAELVWLLIPVLGLVVIGAFIATIVIVCRRRCKKDDGDDTSSDVELQERDKQDDDSLVEDGNPYNSNDVSFRRPEDNSLKRDSIRVTSRRLPDLPVEGQTQEIEEEAPPVPPPPPPPPPDVVSGGAEIRRDDAGTYAMLGADQAPLITDADMEGPYAEGRGLSYPSPDLGGPTHTPPAGSPRVSIIDAKEEGEERNAVYSVINQLEKQKSRKLRQQKEEEEGIRASLAESELSG